MRRIRPAQFCRSWLFLEGANEDVLRRAPASGADVLIQELEDFTPPKSRSVARALAADLYPLWRAAGAVVAVRVNPLEQDGMDDLAVAHAAVINGILSPDDEEIRRARDIVTAFEAARAAGQARVEVDGSLVEMPTYHTAKRLLARGEAMRQFKRVTPV